MNQGKFQYLSDEELVRMLDGSDLTDKEKVLLERLEEYVSQESIEEVEERLHKSYESLIWFYRQAFKDSQREQKYYKERYCFIVDQLHSKEHKLKQIKILLGDNK